MSNQLSRHHIDESELHAHVRGELSEPESATVLAHVATCATCAHELEELGRAHAVLAEVRESEIDFPELRFAAVRTRVMDEVRRQPRAAHRFALPRMAWAVAAGIAMIAVMVGQRPPAVPEQAATPAYRLDAPVELITTSTPDGIALKWEGDQPTYLVLKTHRPGDFRDAEVEVVCGNSWTDTNRAPGLIYYHVVPAEEPCRS